MILNLLEHSNIYMKKSTLYPLFIALIIFPFTTVAQPKIELETKVILNEALEIKIPKGFDIMAEELMELKYPSQRRPTLVYSNKSGGINVGFNLTLQKADQNIIEQYLGVFESSFKNAYPSAEWISAGIKIINGRKIGCLEMITPAMDTKIYNLIFFSDLNEKLLLCTFNCTEKDKNQWEKAAHEIMNSFLLK